MARPRWKPLANNSTLKRVRAELADRKKPGLAEPLAAPGEAASEPLAAPGEAASEPPPCDFRALVGKVEDLGVPRHSPPAKPAPPGPPAPRLRPATQLLLEELGESVYARQPNVPARKLRELATGPLLPFRVLDLHGMTRIGAEHALGRALALARGDGMRTLIVICGRGTRSGPAGAVLPDWVVTLLRGPFRGHLLAFCTAPAQFGGQGALLVALKKWSPRPSPAI